MANINDLKDIIKHTRIDQAILLQGPHGMGKSEILKKILEDDGYKVTILFLGQAADPGDIVGLPHKFEVVDEHGKRWVTTFASPEWWPTDPEAKHGIIFDEINRSKSDVRQCIQDMTLNFTLNGKKLPKHTRIFAAMNPTSDGYYDVEELDPSLVDRFNVYDFNPTPGEWLDWARTEGDVHEAVVGFIEKHLEDLDAPPPSDSKNAVGPSRRSWVRVSNNIKEFPKLLENRHVLINQMMGIVGSGIASKFGAYLKEFGSGITAGLILTKWDDKISMKISKMDMQQQIHLITQICIYLDSHLEEIRTNKTMTALVCGNLNSFINSCISLEASAMFFTKIRDVFQAGEKDATKKKMWPLFVVQNCRQIADKFTEVIRGN
jgi:hypothetical protein